MSEHTDRIRRLAREISIVENDAPGAEHLLDKA